MEYIGDSKYNPDHTPDSKFTSPEYSSDSKMTPDQCDPWTRSIEEHLRNVIEDLKKAQKDHERLSGDNERYDAYLRLPSLLLPCIYGAIIPVLSDNRLSTVVSTTGFVMTGMCTITCSYFQFQSKAKDHSIFANKHSEIIREIEGELIKRKEFRTNADVFCTYLRLKIDNLTSSRP